MQTPTPEGRSIAAELRQSLSLFGFLVLALAVPAVAGLAISVT
ncbi:MAG: hypothetical protein WEA10_03340 [Actinomycetota bacterium]